MWRAVIITSVFFGLINGERAGITHCTADTYPASLPTVSTTDGGTGTAYLVENEDYMFMCCGVVSQWNIDGGATGGAITYQIWRQTAAEDYTLISSGDHTAAGGADTYAVPENARMSFREGDLIGWSTTGADVVGYAADGSVVTPVSRHSGTVGTPAVGSTQNWGADTAHFSRRYAIQAVTSPSTTPYFKNLPQYKEYTDVQTVTAAVTIMTLNVNDLDPEDASGLTVTMDPAWTDYFDLSATLVVSTARVLPPGIYMPVFRVEEEHCGQTASATLTVSVTESLPSITNLPAYVDVHEDSLDETLLYTVTTSDPVDQAIWCKGDWTVGTQTSANTPFIVKMLSTAAGSSEAGVYLIEWPELTYNPVAPMYTLTIVCTDTGQQTATGTLYVNIIQNQAPVFINLPFVVVVDAATVIPATVVYTVSTSDADADQITYGSSCVPLVDCPFDLYDSGDVVVRESLLLWNTGDYTMTVTAVSLRHTTTTDGAPQFDLVIHIINRNTAPTLTNVGVTISVAENSALSSSILQVSATDSDTANTLVYYMTVAEPEGYGLFVISSTGYLTTHATDVIDFENLGTTTFTATIYVHDGKEVTKGTLTLRVTDVNEAPVFSQSAYSITQPEDVSGTALPDPVFTVIDNDSADTPTFTLDCGTTYSDYFAMVAGTGVVTFAQDYDLDPGVLPTSHTCSVTVTDSANNTATTTLYITIEYANNHSPTFSSTPYQFTLATDTVLGTSIFKVTVTDADAGTDGAITLSLDQSSLAGTFLFLDSDGTLYTSASLTSFTDGDTRSITVTATDGGTSSNVVPVIVNIIFSNVAVTTTTTTDRNVLFIEDERSVYWLTAACIAGLGLLLTIVFIIYRYCRDRKEPLFSWELNLDCLGYAPKRHVKKERVIGRRPKPLERERAPAIRQLRAPPFMPSRLNLYPRKGRVSDVTTEMSRPPSTRSLLPGRATAELADDLDKKRSLSPDPFALIDEHPPPVPTVAPAHSFSIARGAELEYLHGPRSVGVASDIALGDADDITPVPTPEPSDIDAEGLYTTKDRLRGKSNRVSVSPSPIWWDNTTTKHIAGTSMRLGEESKEEKLRKPGIGVHMTPVPETPTDELPKTPEPHPPTPGTVMEHPTPLPVQSPIANTPTPEPIKTPHAQIPTPAPTPLPVIEMPRPKPIKTPTPTQSPVAKSPHPVQSPIVKTPSSTPIPRPAAIHTPIAKTPTPTPITGGKSLHVTVPTTTQSPGTTTTTPDPISLPGTPVPVQTPTVNTPTPIPTPLVISPMSSHSPPATAPTPKLIQTPEKIPPPVRSPIVKTPSQVSIHTPVAKTMIPSKSPTAKSPMSTKSPIPVQSPVAKTPMSIKSPDAKIPTRTPVQSPVDKSPTPVQSPAIKAPIPIQSPFAKTHTSTKSPDAQIETPTPIQSPVDKRPTSIKSPVTKPPTFSAKTPATETPISIPSPDMSISIPVETPDLYNSPPIASPETKTPTYIPVQIPAENTRPVQSPVTKLAQYVPVRIPIEKTTEHTQSPVKTIPTYVPVQIPIEKATRTTMQPAVKTPAEAENPNDDEDKMDDAESENNTVRVTPSPIWWDNTTTSYITGATGEVSEDTKATNK